MKQWPEDNTPLEGQHLPGASGDGPLRRKKTGYLLTAFLIALLLHILLLPILLYEMRSPEMPTDQGPLKVRLASPTPAQSRTQAPVTPSQPLPKQRQLVDIAKPKEEKRPEKADYLSEYDSAVKEQTRSSKATLRPTNVTETPQQGKQEKSPDQGNTKPLKKAGSQENAPKRLAEPLAPGLHGDRLPSAEHPAPLGEAGEDQPNPLVPSLTELGQYTGAPFSDHLKDVEEDAATRLNTLQWRYASFFNRIKERVGKEWDPRTPIRRYDPQGVKIGNQERLTVVKATIDRNGNVIHVMVQQPSGVYYLDDEALRAFRESGPFPNPPLALFGGKATFSFDFGFYLSNEGRGGIDLDWKPY